MSKVVYEGWMVRYGRRKLGRSFIHMRYFVLESRLLAYYKRKPQDNVVPIKTLLIDGNCRVEDRGLKTHHGHEYLLALLAGVVLVGIAAVPPLGDREIRVLGFVYGIEMEVPEPHSSLKLNVCFLGEKIFRRDAEEADDVEGVGQHLEERDLTEGALASQPHKAVFGSAFVFNVASKMVYVLSIYNKKEKYHRITMAAFNIQEALIWKEKIESVIDQHQESLVANGNKYHSFEYKSGMDSGRNASSSDHESQYSAPEDEEDDSQPNLMRRTTIGNGPPESVFDWTQESSDLANQNTNNQAFSRKHWRLLQCQNGLRIFEELLEVDFLPKSCSRAMKAVGVVDATCEEIFELVMSMDTTRFEEYPLHWPSSALFGPEGLVCFCQWDGEENVKDLPSCLIWNTFQRRLKLDCNSIYPNKIKLLLLGIIQHFAIPDTSSSSIYFTHRWDCSFQFGSLVEEVDGHTAILYHRLQLDWFPTFVWPRDLCYVRYWRRNDDGSYGGGFNISPLKPRNGRPRAQVQHLMQIDLKGWGVGYMSSFQQHCLLQMLNSVAGLREYFSQTDERNIPPRIPVMVNMASASVPAKKSQKLQESSVHRSHSLDQISTSNKNSMLDEYSDEDEDFQNPDEEIPAGKHLLDLVAVDWFKDTKRMDHVVRRRGCAAQVASEKGLFSFVVNLQVPGSTHYSMVFYFVTKELAPGSLLQRFVDGDDEFRNSRLKLIPSVPKIDVDIGSSTVANGVLGLVVGVITSLVVDMAFLVQANTTDELPERLIGAVRVSHIELSSAIVPKLDQDSSNSAQA
ncbi:hypothetical protein RJ640_024509 [Escallonia rubra]|uniref:Uncharacterized protein n=1 Tax=Escallonia rubra TaxID=112253 RepID=A0AA88S9V2_9ASTE|nr:hypothetical protein RJ640_024509 [Escallonia rubra]